LANTETPPRRKRSLSKQTLLSNELKTNHNHIIPLAQIGYINHTYITSLSLIKFRDRTSKAKDLSFVCLFGHTALLHSGSILRLEPLILLDDAQILDLVLFFQSLVMGFSLNK
jgi:hypothetical protein